MRVIDLKKEERKRKHKKRKKIKCRGAVVITPANNGRKAPPAVKIAWTTPPSNLPLR